MSSLPDVGLGKTIGFYHHYPYHYRFWALQARPVTRICSPAQVYQLHFDLDPDKWRLSPREWVCEPVSAANQHVIVSWVMRRGNSPNHNPHSLHASGNVCQVSSSSLRVPPVPPSCSVSLRYSHFLFLILYIYRSGLISGAIICGFNPPRFNGCF